MRNRWRARIISLGRAKPLEEHACYTVEHDKLIVYLTGPTLPIRWILQHRSGISSRNIVQYYNRTAFAIVDVFDELSTNTSRKIIFVNCAASWLFTHTIFLKINRRFKPKV